MAEAYVTLATNDGYAIGALVLGHSLCSNHTTKDLCIMIAPAVSMAIRSLLEAVYTKVVVVDVLDSGDSAHLALMKRPELGVTFTKLHCWTLTQYSKCVFLDADILCVQNPDDLFEHPELTAVCDVGWPDCFNSGMFVFVPNQDTYGRLLNLAETTGSFDGGDQGLLNSAFPNWHRVSFVYNMVASATYTYLPAYKQYGANAKLVHFLGTLKPWQHRYDASSGSVATAPSYIHLAPYLNSWWAIYQRLVQPSVPDMHGRHNAGVLTNWAALSQDLHKVSDVGSPVEDIQDTLQCVQSVEIREEGHKEERAPSPPSEVKQSGIVVMHRRSVGRSQGTGDQVWRTEVQHKVSDGHFELIEASVGSTKVTEPGVGSTKVPDQASDGCGEVEYIDSDQSLQVEPFDIISHYTKDGQQMQQPEFWCIYTTIEQCVEVTHQLQQQENQQEQEQEELEQEIEKEDEVAQQLSGLSMDDSLAEGKARWERGEPDYLGRDSFANIQAYIDSKLKDVK